MAKILIIGAGVSGLSAGIYARLHGHEAVLCERHNIPGGNLTGWKRGEYHIDNCIHWLTGTNPASNNYKIWEDVGVLGDIEVFQGEALFTCEHNGEILSLGQDIDKLESDMLKISPEDEKEIRSFIKAVKIFQGACGIAGADHNERTSLLGIIFKIPAIMKYYRLTTGELSKRFKHPLLNFFFRAFWGEDFGAFSLVFVFAHFCGANGGIPKGSSCAMAKRMADRFNELGGTLLLRKEAAHVNTENGKATSVTFKDGETIYADYVVITGDPASAFGKYLDAPMPQKFQKMYDDPRLRRFSSYHCAFACHSEKLPFHGDYIFEIPEEYRSVLNSKQLIIREFSHEKDFAPKGKNIIQTLTYAYEEDATAFIDLKKQDPEAYKSKKKELSSLIQSLIEEHFSELSGKLECIDVWTPATYNRYTDSQIGSWMSFILPSKTIPLRIRSDISGVDGVILATQWLQSPGGLPIAAEGGRIAIETITKKEKTTKQKR